jgi:demethylmenaquinone methyltransferase/2-methoxy-6-polyprenyl-1,4-benzoquinol methylase
MSERINEMFSKIAKHYDMMNHRLSLGADIRWRRAAAKECMLDKSEIEVLDVATGTGDLAIAIGREAQRRRKRVMITGMDFNEDMLEIARDKVSECNLKDINFKIADALVPTSKDNSYDIISCGFALRNFDSLPQFIEECSRVLRPGGRIVFVEVAKPDTFLSSFFRMYYFRIVPVMTAKYNKEAYNWLISSLWKFDKERLKQLVEDSGFDNIKVKNLTFGAAFLLTATKSGKKVKPGKEKQ